MITILTGANSFTRGAALRDATKEFATTYGAEHIERVSGESLELKDLPSLLQGASLFSANRMVVIRDLSVNKEVAEAFLSYLEKVPEETAVVLVEGQLDKRSSFYKNLKKQPGFQEFNEPQEVALLSWASEYAKEQGGSLSSGAARTLLEYVGADQQRLAHEIEKLVAYQPEITNETIENLVERRPQSTVFQLLDYALSGQQEKAQKTLESLEKAFEDPFQIANLLIWQVQVLAVVKSAGSRPDAEIAKDTKINPYVISKTKKLAHRIDRKKLNNIINQTAELDIRLKSSSASPWRLIEHTILSF